MESKVSTSKKITGSIEDGVCSNRRKNRSEEGSILI